MKLYNSLGPNPGLVRMFIAEKGIDVALEEVDLMGGENRKPPYNEKNPTGQLPSLELDDGTVIAETVPICEYLEEQHPTPALIGTNAEERAETRMWTRRIELNVTEPLAAAFRYGPGLGLFKERIRTLPEAQEGLAAQAQDGMVLVDRLLAGKQFLAGDRFTLADIVLFTFLGFGAAVGQPIDPDLKNLNEWFARVGARPSAEAAK